MRPTNPEPSIASAFACSFIFGSFQRQGCPSEESHIRKSARNQKINGTATAFTLDPAAAKQEQHRAEERAAEAARLAELEARANTFEAICAEYLASRDVTKLCPTMRRERARHIAKKLAPWSKRSITEIAKRDVFKILDPIAATKPILASRSHATLTHFFWAERHDHIAVNPIKHVSEPLEDETPRDPALTDAELAIVWKLAGMSGYPWTQFFRLAILTGARR